MDDSSSEIRRLPSVRRRQSIESSIHSDDMQCVGTPIQSHYCPSSSLTLRSRHNASVNRGRNIAFVIDLLENATSKGTLTEPEAISAFDHWLTDRTTPSDTVTTTASQRLVTSDDSGIGRYYHSDSCPSAQTSISDSLSTASEPPLSPRPGVRRAESLNHRPRSTGRIFVRSISRLFGACGAPKAGSPPSENHPWRHPRRAPLESRHSTASCPLRRVSKERPLPQLPTNSSPEPSGAELHQKEQPIYAEYDVLVSFAESCTTSPPTVTDDFDSIYDEADEFQESCDTLVSDTTMPSRSFPPPGHVHRLDSGIDIM